MDRVTKPGKSKLGFAILQGACNSEKAKDLVVDLSDKVIDSILEAGVLHEIPVIKTILAAKNACASISDRLFFEKVFRFILACPQISDAEREAFTAEHLRDPKKAERLSEAIVLVLDRLDDFEKTKTLAKVF